MFDEITGNDKRTDHGSSFDSLLSAAPGGTSPRGTTALIAPF
jgi:hypothetical protein